MPQSLSKNVVHLIFSTKERRPFLKTMLGATSISYLGVVLKNMNCPTIIMNSVEDHIHILFLQHRTKNLSEIVQVVKQSSSKWLKSRPSVQRCFTWQTGYGAFSISESRIASVKIYIQNQQEKHREVSFQEEFISFLKKYNIEYDERYLWD